MKTLSQLTAELQALFSGPEKWTSGGFAKDASGADCAVKSERAICFCLLGGCWKVEEFLSQRLAALCHRAIQECGWLDIKGSATWQDAPGRTFADIQKVLAKMAEIAAR